MVHIIYCVCVCMCVCAYNILYVCLGVDGHVCMHVRNHVYMLTTALSYTLYCLAKHKEHQEICRKEVRDALAGRDSDDITWYSNF